MIGGRLRWQCKRGMRELDELLLHYLRYSCDAATDAEKTAFHSLLALSDPEPIGYLLGNDVQDDSVTAGVIESVRGTVET
jgi:antitoxin CptB